MTLKSIDHVVALILHIQFIPRFVHDAKKRMREIGNELERMLPVLTTDDKRRGAFQKVVSAIVGKLKEIVIMGINAGICATNGKSDLNVVPRVTAMYREYADNMIKVSEYSWFDLANPFSTCTRYHHRQGQ